MEQKKLNYYLQDELDEDLNIDLKKIFFVLWSRKFLICKIFASVFVFFILLTFILPKKWQVDADLYINKSNNTNMAEINPYFIEEIGSGGGMAAMLSGGGGNLMNEIELMQSPLVIDKVIKENDLRFKPLFGFIPTAKTGEYLTTEKFLKKKNLKIEIKKGTNVVSISYKNKNKDLAYAVVTSLITNYVELRKELMNEKAKSDTKILESEYNKVKADLDKRIKTVNGLPSNAMTGAGNLAAMSAFSKSAQTAMSTMQGQFIAGEKSQIALREDTEKLTQLSSKLQWAKLVDSISDSSKVVLLKEPLPLRDWEYKSPKLLINIILGIVFGAIASLIGVILKEITDKKLAYSMLGDEIIYNVEEDLSEIKKVLLANNDKSVTIVAFNSIPNVIISELQKYRNINYVQADLTEDFVNGISNAEKAILFVSVGKTDSKLYKSIKEILSNKNKQIIKEVLV